ncbi:MAG: 6-phospho-3-hexuloisomerase [Anaerolineae bacterium]|nr:6-phospho-3-hexuloisomerase [Anaerolineae bacterium]
MPDYNELVTVVTNEVRAALRSVDPESVTSLRQDITDARRVFVAGQGRSGLKMQAFAMRLMHLDQNVHVIGAVTTPAIGPGDLLIIGSGSGRTDSLVTFARRARERNAQVALITIAEESPIGAFADTVIRIAAASPKLKDKDAPTPSIQPLGSLFEQALGLLLDIVVIQLMDDLNTDQDAMFARHANLE